MGVSLVGQNGLFLEPQSASLQRNRFNKEQLALLFEMLLSTSRSIRMFCNFLVYFPMFWKNVLLETKFNLYKMEEWYGYSSIRIKLFYFTKEHFCNFTKFLIVVLTQPTCLVHLHCTRYKVPGPMALWPSGLGIGLYYSMHTKCLICGFDSTCLSD